MLTDVYKDANINKSHREQFGNKLVTGVAVFLKLDFITNNQNRFYEITNKIKTIKFLKTG